MNVHTDRTNVISLILLVSNPYNVSGTDQSFSFPFFSFFFFCERNFLSYNRYIFAKTCPTLPNLYCLGENEQRAIFSCNLHKFIFFNQQGVRFWTLFDEGGFARGERVERFAILIKGCTAVNISVFNNSWHKRIFIHRWISAKKLFFHFLSRRFHLELLSQDHANSILMHYINWKLHTMHFSGLEAQ